MKIMVSNIPIWDRLVFSYLLFCLLIVTTLHNSNFLTEYHLQWVICNNLGFGIGLDTKPGSCSEGGTFNLNTTLINDLRGIYGAVWIHYLSWMSRNHKARAKTPIWFSKKAHIWHVYITILCWHKNCNFQSILHISCTCSLCFYQNTNISN